MSAIERPDSWQIDSAVLRSTARTHVGRVRRINEDRVFDCSERAIWAVADGMGGHRGGDVAAQSVVDALRASHVSSLPGASSDVIAALADANQTIFARNARLGEQAGATVVAVSVHGAAAHIAWAGDSRCYRVRGDSVDLLTRDHSVVQDLVDAGLLTEAMAARHPQANVITRALGVEPTCAVEMRSVDLADGDRFVLCSDGLSRSLTPVDFVGDDIDYLADALVANALERDGSDNISLVLLEWRSGGA